MNNEQFRKLIQANSAKSPDGQKNAASSTPSGFGASAATLGSRQKSSIPMTPRSVAGAGARHNDFARQLAERNQGDRPQKKFRSAAPKGSKFSEGYVDRAKQRHSEEEDERAARIKALEESLKKEEIDQETFNKLRNQIAGGDLSSTHLVKGLDFKLLERIRKGEDVYVENSSKDKQSGPDTPIKDEAEPAEDVDDAFEELEDREVTAVAREKAKKKGQLATTPLVPGKKRTRDQILAELKAAREAAKAKEESALGGRFKKIGAKKEPGTRIERDSKGREVLIITDEDGNEKRKVRKVAAEKELERDAFRPDPTATPLGMEVPDFYKQKQQQEEEENEKEVHVFSDVESDYDPLAGLATGSDDSDESEAEDAKPKPTTTKEQSSESEGEIPDDARSKEMPPPPKPQAAVQARNYFKDSKTALVSEESGRSSALNDPSVLAALKKAKTLNAAAKSEEEEQEAAREERLKKMLRSSERDDEDLDMGFGTNRLADEEDMEDTKIKLSAWGDDNDGGHEGGGKSKRKRGPKKRKGDVNSAADVLKAMERRKAAES